MKEVIFLDNGFFFGKGFFETIKVLDRKPILLKEHLDRINNSLKFFGIDQRLNEDEVYNFINDYEGYDYALKIAISDENKIFTTREDPYNSRVDGEIKLNFASTIRNSTSVMVYHKSFNYMDNILEKQKSKANGFFEPIFLNEKGFVTEGAVSNVFFIKEENIYTPKVESGLLDGVMRKFFIRKFDVEEIFIKKEDLKEFESGFITNSLMGYIEFDSLGGFSFKRSELAKEFDEKLESIGFKYNSLK